LAIRYLPSRLSITQWVKHWKSCLRLIQGPGGSNNSNNNNNNNNNNNTKIVPAHAMKAYKGIEA